MKPHYPLLDGLRGTAALLVLVYHLFEGYAFAGGEAVINGINHGYLAVDFFFMLSGFVLGYAYDDRFRDGSLTTRSFLRRRVVRLHPMVLMGAVIGVLFFLFQGSVRWDGTPVGGELITVAFLMGILMIPCLPGMACDIRGNGEMFPLNGPAWSLFFEYIGSIVYALVLRRFSNAALTMVTAVSGLCLALFLLFDVSGYGMLGIGWTLDTVNFLGGFLRMIFPFTLGLLLCRRFKPLAVRGAFWWCSLLLLLLFIVPYIPGSEPFCLNGLYEIACLFLAFPLIVVLAASGKTTDRRSTQICNFFGDISYPVYIVHYPVYYLFYAWLIETQRTSFAASWWQSCLVLLFSVALAYACLKWYDRPVRRFLSRSR